MIPYGRQSISEEDVGAVVAALRSDYLTCGPLIERFERAFADRVGAGHAVAVNSATSALHLALRVLGVGAGARVVTSPNTFVASANCAAFVGAIPDFVDIDPTSRTLDPDALEKAWSSDTKAVVAVDFAGQSADMPRIAEIARRNRAFVIEDACHGVGGSFDYQGNIHRIGGHPWADITTFSFHPVKTMTTGEGGMLVTDRADWAAAARRLRSHGVQREDFCGLGDPAFEEWGPWYYEMRDLGYNYRLTDLQAALGLSQLSRLDRFIARRREIVACYDAAFEDLACVCTPRLRNPRDADLISWHLYSLEIDFAGLGTTRTEFMAALRERGVGSQVHYIPVHLQPWYRETFSYSAGKCPRAEQFYQRALSIPLYPDMADEDVDRVIRSLRELAS